MKAGSTIFLKGTIVLIGLLVLGVCTFVLPRGIISEFNGDFDYGLVIVGMYVPAIPFFIGLYQAFKLLKYIEQNQVFSFNAVKSLRIIKLCAFIISALYTAGFPYVFYLAEMDDAPGLAAMALIIIFASAVVATAAAVFENLLQKAVEIKSENDLTV